MIQTIAISFAALVAVVVVAFVVVGPDRFWRIAGPPDLGNVVFETLTRRGTPNDALACPSGLCRAASDIVSPVYPVGPADLRSAFARMLGREARVEKLDADDAVLQDRYLQRTPLLGFPDTIVVRFLAAGEGRSTIAVYSRSRVGRKDFGANRQRIERWLSHLSAEVLAAR